MKIKFQHSPLHAAIYLSLVSLTTLSTANSFAQDDVTQLPVITVKADTNDYADGKIKKAAPLGILGEKSVVDTPFTVTTYTGQAIQDTQSTTVAEVLKADPAIRTTTNEGHLNENFNIRGFASTWEDYNMNGMYGVAPTGRIPTDILDSVTLLKGPNALIAGTSPTGTVGGVIMAHTKRATRELTQVSASYEDGGYYKSGFDIAHRLGTNDEFGVRASGSYGTGEHIINNMDDSNATGLLALDYSTDKLKLNFDSYVVRDKRDGGSPAMVCFSCSNPGIGMVGIGSVLKAPDGDSNYFANLKGRQESQFSGLSAEYKFTPNFKANAGIAYAEREYVGHLFGTRMMVGTITGNAANGITGTYPGNENNALTQYYRVGSKEHNTAANLGFEGKFNTGAIAHTVGLRADYLTRKFTQHYAPTTAYFVTNLYNPSIGDNAEMPTNYPVIGPYGDNEYISYTLTDQLSMLDDKLQFILGARYQDMDIKTYNVRATKWIPYSSDKVSPSLAIVVKPFDANLSFYASYVEGLSEGVNISELNYPKAVNKGETFAPYQTKQYEAGAKYQAGSWLTALSLYQIEKPGLLEETLSATETRVADDAKTRSRGVELSSSGNITQDLSILANLAYIDTEYTKSAPIIEGNNIEGVPDFTAGVTLDYKIPQLEGLSVNGRATYVSKQYLNSDNTLELPDYAIFDLGAKYATKIGGVDTTLRANVDNITNKKYWAGVFNNNYATVGDARTYKLGVSFDF